MTDLEHESFQQGSRKAPSRPRQCPIVHIQDIRRIESAHEDWFLEEEAPCPLLSTLESVLDFDHFKLEAPSGSLGKSKEDVGLQSNAAEGRHLARDPQATVRQIADEVEFYVYVEPERDAGQGRGQGSYIWLEDLSAFAEGGDN